MKTAILTVLAALLVLGHPAAAATDAKARLEDLAALRSQYVDKTRSFTPAGREKALAVIDGLERRADGLSDTDLLVGVLRVIALAHNAHDSLSGAAVAAPPARLPIHLIWFADALVVARADARNADLLGARVIALDGVDPARLLERLEGVSSGVPDYIRWNATWFYERASLLHALGVAKAGDRVRLDLVLPDGRRVSRLLADVPTEAMPKGLSPKRVWSRAPAADEAARGWRTAAGSAAEPLYLQDPDEPFRMTEIPELNALYVQLRANMDTDGHAISPFVAGVREALKARGPRNVILDLRFNTGGNILLTRSMARDIATTTPGRVFVLTGPFTFSAGIVTAAATKHDGGARVTLVGEPVGDALRFWSESRAATCLPNSHYCMNANTGLWDLTHNCKGEAGCFGDFLDARVDSLTPDIAAPITSKAWLAGRDPGMEAVAAALAN